MRGKVVVSTAVVVASGITPAYAGKRSRNGIHLTMSWDHPRLCGEKAKTEHLHSHRTGSPPPMRGKDEQHWKKFLSDGITPAYAGKSSLLCRCRIHFQDHPRLCGEKTKKIPKQRYFFHQPASFSFSLQYT